MPFMKRNFRRNPRPERGQTIIVAMIIMGLLLILGFVFIGIINRNVKSTGRNLDRSVASDLSEAGIRYAHSQMLRSELGADWRGIVTLPIALDTDQTLSYDPDALYLRQPATLADGVTRLPYFAGGQQVDLGGPDGLGPFFRVNYERGRSLVRVRYAQSDASLFVSNPLGPLRSPGLAKNYLIIESVGREGRVSATDPTTSLNANPRKVRSYQTQEEFQQNIASMRQDNAKFAQVPIKRAFVPIGITDSALFVTNKNRVTRPAQIGIPADLNLRYRDPNNSNTNRDLASRLALQLGTTFALPNRTTGLVSGDYPGGGSIFVNGDLELSGLTQVNLNAFLGDFFSVSGSIKSDQDFGGIASLGLAVTRFVAGNWAVQSQTVTSGDYDSDSPTFGSFAIQQATGILRDGRSTTDTAGNVRGIGRKEPPSLLDRDPQTGATRYISMTRDSGGLPASASALASVNTGYWGHGRGVYVNNGASRQTPVSLSSLGISGGETSLTKEWLSPGGDPQSTGWRGWQYSPKGAYTYLLPDGFTIDRDGSGDEGTWRHPVTGELTGLRQLRYRIGRGTDGRTHIVNTLSFSTSMATLVPNYIDRNLSRNDFQRGPVFNGVVYFEGNVRIRGIVPTDVQMTVVSNATIYIEGSITKGVVGNAVTANYGSNDPYAATPVGNRLSRPSASMLMLMAKDYVALNTTQFFGPARGQTVTPKEDLAALGSYNPLVLSSADPNGLRLSADFVLRPPTAADQPNPRAWKSAPETYDQPTKLLMAHAMDRGGGAGAFFTLDINQSSGVASSFFFPVTFPRLDVTSAAQVTNLWSDFQGGDPVPVYGLGGLNSQKYPVFETAEFDLVNPLIVGTSSPDSNVFSASSGPNIYALAKTGANDLWLRPTSPAMQASNDYLLGRFAITPHDIRIEASIYAEEGSFFVIPGPWFNPNPEDTYASYLSNCGGISASAEETLTNVERDACNARRYALYGAFPSTPFYGEPLDVKIRIFGAISENVTPPMSAQAEWLRKWGWIPGRHGSSGVQIPAAHADDPNFATNQFAPNLTVTYDPVLATGRLRGFAASSNPRDNTSPTLRYDDYGQPLPPLPRLPVSSTLAYFGEVH